MDSVDHKREPDKKSNFQKNICANISKRILKEMFQKRNAPILRLFCAKNRCQEKSFLNFCNKYKNKPIGIE
jgi:hypothetical protein